jgi:hypothetical protein
MTATAGTPSDPYGAEKRRRLTRSIMACFLASSPALPPLLVTLPSASPACPDALVGVTSRDVSASFSTKGSDRPAALAGVRTGVTFKDDTLVNPMPRPILVDDGEGEAPKRLADGRSVEAGR